ncbi:FAD-dependent oxidoreductase [Arthrobacter sp. Br18]|uniref:FAD-dependent oxidoreductase n=1 Tax=Arthrobacter sp. Br18 TaxID=1312954 RepID=UPI00047C9D69|nr:FAD-dependent oxidoreductase [Arthrobacter sp. Br18]
MVERLIVVGGDAAGMSAASAARRQVPGSELEIIAFERGNHTSYSACGIPYFIGKDVADAGALIARTPEEFSRNHDIDARVKHEVLEIDLNRRAVRVRDLSNGTDVWEGFDQLMVATGALPVRPLLPGSGAEGIYGVQTLDEGLALRAALEREQPRRAVIVGTGYIGLELAEALCAWGVEITVVGRGQAPLPGLDPDMGILIADAMLGYGMNVRLNETVTGFETTDGKVSAVVTDQTTLAADVVILGLGVRPNTALAAQAGIPLGETGAIAVDQRLRTGIDGVWAAGDCVEKFHRVARRHVRMALGTHANKEGRTAGINIGGSYATFPGVIGTAVTKICDVEAARTGLGEDEARQAGFDPITEVVESTTRAGYYPGAKPIRTKLIAERGTGRLLGGQIVGEEGAAKRIDVLAVALWHEMTVEELLNIDLSYAPPFSPLWDPVLIAARKTWQKVAAERTGTKLG